MIQSTNLCDQFMLMRVLRVFLKESYFAIGTSRPSSEDFRIPSAETGSINILCVVDIARGPVDLLYLLQGFDVPELKLFLRRIAASQHHSILVIQGLT